MNNINITYNDLAFCVLDNGFWYEDPNRPGIQRLQIPKSSIEHDLTSSFPAISTKELNWKSVIAELVWFIRGDTNINYLLANGVNIWNRDAYTHYRNRYRACNLKATPLSYNGFLDATQMGTPSPIANYEHGDLGPVYGDQWRNYEAKVDQLTDLIYRMKRTPMSTELILTAWNPSDIPDQALPPCHFGFQIMMQPLTDDQRHAEFRRVNAGKVTSTQVCTMDDYDRMNIARYGFELRWTQRSVDTFLGLPFNIASYAVLAHIMGKMSNSVPLMLSADLRNVHLYENSTVAMREQLGRNPIDHDPTHLLMKDAFYDLCEDNTKTIPEVLDLITPDMFKLYKYTSDPAIKVPMLPRSVKLI